MVTKDGWHTGKVIHGMQNGTKFGFPTANLQLYEYEFLETGIFAVIVRIDDCLYKGMLYVGTRPTLGLEDRTYEINIFDFEKSIYDKELSFFIVDKIRNEKKFLTVVELIEQLQKDRNAAEKILSK